MTDKPITDAAIEELYRRFVLRSDSEAHAIIRLIAEVRRLRDENQMLLNSVKITNKQYDQVILGRKSN